MASDRDRILMCPPDYFSVDYVINPWMDGQEGQPNIAKAKEQWSVLRDAIAECADVVTMDPQPDLPDLVFTANAGVVLGKKAIASHFMPMERRPEEAHNKQWFRDNGYELLDLDEKIGFEGAGDCLFRSRRPVAVDRLRISYRDRGARGDSVVLRHGGRVDTAHRSAVLSHRHLLLSAQRRFLDVPPAGVRLRVAHRHRKPGAFAQAHRRRYGGCRIIRVQRGEHRRPRVPEQSIGAAASALDAGRFQSDAGRLVGVLEGRWWSEVFDPETHRAAGLLRPRNGRQV